MIGIKSNRLDTEAIIKVSLTADFIFAQRANNYHGYFMQQCMKVE